MAHGSTDAPLASSAAEARTEAAHRSLARWMRWLGGFSIASACLAVVVYWPRLAQDDPAAVWTTVRYLAAAKLPQIAFGLLLLQSTARRRDGRWGLLPPWLDVVLTVVVCALGIAGLTWQQAHPLPPR